MSIHQTPAGKKAPASPSAVLAALSTVTIALLFIAPGCATVPGKQTVVVKHYPQCYEPITTLREEAKQLSTRIAQGAVGGALLGAVAGAMTGETENILIGAAIGAVAGATVSYIVTKDVQQKNQAERFATYAQYMDEDYKTLNSAVTSARSTAGCYRAAYNKLKSDYQAGRMSREEMLERVKEIQAGSSDAKEILQYYNDASVANIKTFEAVHREEMKRTTDKPSPARAKGYNKKLEQNKGVVNQATLLDQDLDGLLTDCDTMIKMVKSRLIELAKGFDTGKS
ncbi:MAG: glycine zipper 2TM domain-containing protein [Deltaproteobacteria bacterium]|jgi:uncharacterized membrane protein|nr:glycine zipper 2TM domain-containing protein [Deltaproteobacteria bacterium]